MRLWHGPSGPSDRVHLAESNGTSVLILGHCSLAREDQRTVARQVAAGDLTAMTSVGGSCVVIAASEDMIVVTGDLAGQRVVFHARTPEGQPVAGSHANRLASLVDGTLSREWLATRLLVPGAADVWWPGSPWSEVAALRPGWALQVTGHRVQPRQLTMLPAPENDVRKAGDLVGHALSRAVTGRVDEARHPTVDLSGGWDSSTVAALAARAQDASVSAISLTVPGVDDVGTARKVAEHAGGLEHLLWLVPREVVPYSDLESVPFLDEPAAHVANSSRSAWWLRGIADTGSDLHLSGDGGDAVLSALPSYLGDLARVGTLREFGKHVNGWASLRHEAPHWLVRAGVALRQTGYGDALRVEADHLEGGNTRRRGFATLVTWLGHSRVAEWMTPEARHLVAARLRRHAAEHDSPVVPGPFGIGDSASWMALNVFGRKQRLYSELAAANGVNHHAPYLDDDVVRACWSAPAWVRTTPEQAKPLIQRAAVGLVPAELANRRTKGDYSALAYQGIRRNADVLHELFTGSRLGALGLVDEVAVRWSVDQGTAGLPVGLGALDALVSTEVWLRGWEKRSAALRGEDVDRARASST